MNTQKTEKIQREDEYNKNRKSGSGNKKKYSIWIFQDWCKSCGICIEFCPKSVFSRDNMGRPVIERADACIGCRFCEAHCPDFAISIAEGEEENVEGGAGYEEE